MAAVKPRNPRTLRNRIHRLMYVSSMINIIVFGLFTLVIISQMFRPMSETASRLVGSTIARDMNSAEFLQQFGIERLEQFDPNTEKARQWIRTHLEETTGHDRFLHMLSEDVAGIWSEEKLDIVLLSVQIEDKVIYSNQAKADSMIDDVSLLVEPLVQLFTVESKHPLIDREQGKVGVVTTAIHPYVGMCMFILLAIMLLVLMLVLLCVSKLMSLLFTLPIIQPINQLEATMKCIAADEDMENAISTTVRLKRPLREIESLVDSTNTIMGKMRSYAELLKEQNDELEAQNMQLEEQRDELEAQRNELEAQRDELEAQKEELVRSQERIQEAKQKLTEQEKSLRSLLNNAGQGFLSFGADLLVREEYSLECVKLFGAGLSGRPFVELIAADDAQQQSFLRSLLGKLFQEKEPSRRSLYMPLLTDELVIDGRHIQLEYKLIAALEADDEESCMVILTDVTEKRLLQSQMEQERNTLKMVVKVVVGYNDYRELVSDYKHFIGERVHALFQEQEPLDASLFELFRHIHTFKGSFSQFGLTHAAQKLHEAESVIAELCKRAEDVTHSEIRAVLDSFHMDEWLQYELEVLHRILGDTFFGQDNVLFIDKGKIVEIERKMVASLSTADCQLLLPELRKLRYKPFKELLRAYPEYTLGLAERMDKMIEPFAIEGDEVLCDSDRYADFARSLVHVFRNLADHGIEPCDVREALGKPELGRVRCDVQLDEGVIVLQISDDGRGIDPEQIKAKAVAKGLIADEAAAALADEAVIELLFHEQFSTKDEVSELSGRGIGLAAVKLETERLGGTLDVSSEPGRGTTFVFRIPYVDLTEVPQLSVGSIIGPLAETALTFFREQVNQPLQATQPFQLSEGDKLSLQNVTTFIRVKGAIDGMLVLSIDKALASTAVRSLVYGSLTPEEELELAEDTLAEATNIIIGNSIRCFPELEPYIVIEPPITLQTEGASMKYCDSNIWTCSLTSDVGAIQLSFVLTTTPE
ncbi:ATP-binding protein [Paenibacillus sp. YYML68]|uniref:ATP-binding protein n=1 Tax=Paenibacillus sp. YYML68 TaxID=2909250 RepID=UPI00248FA5FB|nr:ATP-binding protein [Paenibacillus sp. YYML68]